MNTKIAGIIVAVIILLGLGGFLFLGKNGTSKNQVTQITPTPTVTENSMTQNSLLDLLTGGKTQSCTFTYAGSDGTKTDGTVYISGTKMRGDISTITSSKKESKITMIRDGDITYIWGSDLPTGIKMTLSANDLKSNTQANQYFNSTQKTDYKCSPWSVDSSMFSVPTNIKFTDISSMMKGIVSPTGTIQTGSDPCASITDPTTKTACENALKQSGK